MSSRAEAERSGAEAEGSCRPLAPLGRRLARVVANRASGAYRLFEVDDPGGPPPAAGQFYMLTAARGWGEGGERPYLGRAFSVAAAGAGEGGGPRLGFLVEAVGPGSARLAALAPGEGLWIVGPLGRPFSMPAQLAPGAAEAVLVGGGIGVAPLAVLDRALTAQGFASRTLLGFRDAAHAGGLELFDGEVELASEDGHAGRRGYVTELLAPLLAPGEPARAVYACGPPAMLEAVRALCAAREAACELAMEQGMACGFGACFGCVVPTRSGYVRLCVDGPVVNAAELETVL